MLKFLQNLRMAQKLGLLSGILLLLTGVVCLVGIRGLSNGVQDGKEVILGNQLTANLLQREIDHLNWAKSVSNFIIDDQRQELTVELDPTKCKFGQWYYSDDRKAIEKEIPEVKSELAGIEEPHRHLHQSARKIAETPHRADGTVDRLVAGEVYREETLPALQKVQEHLKQINDTARGAILSDEAMIGNADAFRNRLIMVGILSLVIGVLLTIIIVREITRSLQQGVTLVEEIARGDFSQRLRMERKDEVGRLAVALDQMAENLKQQADVAEEISQGNLIVDVRLASEKDQLGKALKQMTGVLNDTIRQVMIAADNVGSGSQALSAASQEMSQGATEQAASAEEASSSIEEMTANIRQNAENAMQTEKIAMQTSSAVQQAGQASAENMASMKEIAGKIVIIEEIARQTNLLALNAAIEAARAGEHGKGFAVVAAEVRKLAERSQVAAAEINKLSVSSVEIADRAGKMLQEVIPGIQRTAELVQEIAAASREQDAGAEQIGRAIQQLDKVIQQNASATEEMASTAEELSGQSEQLQEMVSFFKVKGGEAGFVSRAGAASKGKVAHRDHLQEVRKKAPLHLELSHKGKDALDEEFERF